MKVKAVRFHAAGGSEDLPIEGLKFIVMKSVNLK